VALLIAHYLEVGSRAGRMLTSSLTALLGAALLAVVPMMTTFAKRSGEQALYQAYQPWVVAAGTIALAGGLAALLYARRDKLDRMVLTLAIAGFASTQLLLAGFEPVGKVRAGTNLLPAIQAELTPAAKVYSVGTYEQSLTFYLGRLATLVDYGDEFTFGLKQQPELSIPTVPAFVLEWRRETAAGRKLVAITRADILEELQRQGVPLRVVAADARRVVIANH
jgi:hypothetical protein